MNLCNQCGSASRDMSGFCKGCGAPWPLPAPGSPATQNASNSVLRLPEAPPTGAVGLMQDVGPKQVWIAVLLALFFGPLGLLYCTIPGTIVMTIVSIPLAVLLGQASLLITLPICAIWAWRAAREMSSPLD
jgi:hypothetical protein